MKFNRILLSISIGTILSLFLFARCSNEETTDVDETQYPEILLVPKSNYFKFYLDFERFSKGLSIAQNNLLGAYVAEIELLVNLNSRIETVTCNCQQGQTHCQASGAFSECCICCASGLSAACGVAFGFATCKCDEPEPPGTGGRLAVSPPDQVVTIYPSRINEMFNYLHERGIKTKEIRVSLNDLIKSVE